MKSFTYYLNYSFFYFKLFNKTKLIFKMSKIILLSLFLIASSISLGVVSTDDWTMCAYC